MSALPPLSDLPRSESCDRLIATLRAGLRPGQQAIADWQGGELAVSAVPGAGKSHSMAVGAAIAIARHQLHARQQLVVVTFTRSAAANIKHKIRATLQQLQLSAAGFMVQTLHGLALHIASRHPEVSGVDLNTMTLITPTRSHRLLRQAVEQWLRDHPEQYQILLRGVQFDGEAAERLRRQSVLRTEVLPNLGKTAIHEAKSSGITPEQLRAAHGAVDDPYDTLAIAADIYAQYDALMRSHHLIDYDDMILAALRVLAHEPVRKLWQEQIFAVFEDEAQDSSPLQAQLLTLLATTPDQQQCHLVRVGDPNQAINSTFTPADPWYFNQFCDRCKERDRLTTMDQSGRSSLVILEAANRMLDWANDQFDPQQQPAPDHLFRRQAIRPVTLNDPQANANPDPTGAGVEIHTPPDVNATVQAIEAAAIAHLTAHPDHNAAILVRENRQAHFLARQLTPSLKARNIPVYDVNATQRHSKIPSDILKILRFINRPHSPSHLKDALSVLEKRDLIAAQDLDALAIAPEQFLYPTPIDPPLVPAAIVAQRHCTQLLRAGIELHPYDLLSFLGLTLQYQASELATLQKLAERLFQQTARQRTLAAIIDTLQDIVTAEQFEAVEADSDDRYTQAGQLTIITMHKAKGLDWDYVFLPFLHEDVIPGDAWIPAGQKFLGDWSLGDVVRAQIRALVRQADANPPKPLPQPDEAWHIAQRLKTAEEYRLLYVAMTRAKRLLWLSAARQGPYRWSMVQSQGTIHKLNPKQPCPVLRALR
ncbi:ATP-dependent helicase [Spirulina major]|uniref:ATP-dependent helicase n=1 Tax=Spirulina major TaxID=270636 RepID=UPI0009345F7A|nr:ATP-dependent helicase [Spirulina major]